MKKALLIFLLIFSAVTSLEAQEVAAPAMRQAPGTTRYYMEIDGTRLAGARNMSYVLVPGKLILDATGAEESMFRIFPQQHGYHSFSDIMTTLGIFGWKFIDTYSYNANGSVTVRWIVAKDVATPMELLDGFVKSKGK